VRRAEEESITRVPRVGVVLFNVDHGGGRVTVDLDTLAGELYAPADEILPFQPSGVAGETQLAGDPSATSPAMHRRAALPALRSGSWP
jgi:hypothetical protein